MSDKITAILLLMSILSLVQSITDQINNESFLRTFDFSDGQWFIVK